MAPVEAREYVAELATRRIRQVRPQGGTFNKRSDYSEANKVVAPDALVLVLAPAEKYDNVAFSECVSDIPAAHTPTRLANIP
jgi:hypothetical protein